MANKLWQKKTIVNSDIERYTIGKDAEMDMYIARYDVLGSMAHAKMLESIGLLEKNDLNAILKGLKEIFEQKVQNAIKKLTENNTSVSYGISWEQSSDTIEKQLTTADHLMYKNKLSYYKELEENTENGN
jgi:hypothetical protein